MGPELANKIPFENMTKHSRSILSEIILIACMFTEVLNQNKSAGFDELTAKVIKSIQNEMCNPLAHIFSLTFITGIISNSLKAALGTPVYKANENFKYYRVFQYY